MKRLFFLFLFIATHFISYAKKQITLEDIWTKTTFKQDAVAGFNSMKNGEYYTEFE